MQDKFTFEYATIRVVPKVEREEFFNVGVILFCKRKKILNMKVHIDPKKLQAYASTIDADILQHHLDAWQAICQGGSAGGKIGSLEMADRFRWLTACRSTIIQSSKTHPGLSADPLKTLESIFETQVL